MISARLLALAGRQHGAVSREQLRQEVAMSSSTISRSVGDGRLIRVANGVFRLASAPDTFESQCAAATLFGGGVGFISGTTAGKLRGLSRMHPQRIELTVPETFRRAPPPWLTLRFTSWYQPGEHRDERDDGIAVATPNRMLFGLATKFAQRRFDNAADDAWNLGLVSPDSVALFLDQNRASGKNGVLRIETWLERALPQQRPSQSYLERDLITALEASGLPSPVRQHRLLLASGEPIHLDAAWPAICLAVEPGHSYFHRFGGGQERDHLRDAGCAEQGWQVIRLNEKMLGDMNAAARIVRDIYRRRRIDMAQPRVSSPNRLPGGPDEEERGSADGAGRFGPGWSP